MRRDRLRRLAIGTFAAAAMSGSALATLGSLPAQADSFAGGFSRQLRLGFQAGDDWEPATAADRFGHVYVLYTHSDVAGGGTCAGCNLHMLVQRSDLAFGEAPSCQGPGNIWFARQLGRTLVPS